METSIFQVLQSSPIPLQGTQCVTFGDEILICGSLKNNSCYSYHTIKNEYKYICSYPENMKLNGHCVMKLVNKNDNEINLLSFGGQGVFEQKVTLTMKYVSVWSNDKKKKKGLE
ncbi:hypothetical protein RFI_09832 [Reticulomyxa filosa]|uniref:IPT/TIG domain-containing protein n=1 Tax=Reticulomyxa filosa TaxID=46433 RepID=X6NPJ5_RETFI|nr:hypothetical protein RFI_09832 [Reticulomyxa filosa]|eukprot:ETO27297.1 hypothetical protein RFI_09832 [Reticulomyxa filosa]